MSSSTKTVKMPIEQWEQLKEIRKRFGISYIDQVRIAVAHYLSVMEKICQGIDEGDEYTKELMDKFSDTL